MRPAQVARYRTRMPVEVSVPERMGYFFLSRDRPCLLYTSFSVMVGIRLNLGEKREYLFFKDVVAFTAAQASCLLYTS